MCYRQSYHHKWKRHSKRGHRGRHMARHFAAEWGSPPANVLESDDRYELFLYAAGYEKSDFQVRVKDDLLHISAEKPVGEKIDWRRREFFATGFERRWELNEKVDKGGITARYEDGILKVTLPKLEGFESTSQDVLVV